ncbi:MAG: peptidase M13 [Streptococcaceae bacterium]|jgi:putative endopeptidase|nr:peptidase M13 [Streptococcaceae bacterium]
MVRIQDDLFEAVNADWLEETEIPADKPRIAAFGELEIEIEKQLADDFAELVEKEPEDKFLREAIRFYKKVGDWPRRNADNFSSVRAEVAKVSELKSLSDLSANLSDLILHSQATLPFGLSVEADMMDAVNYMLTFQGPSLILPDTTYYAEEHPRKKELLDFWKENVAELLGKLGIKTATQIAEDAVKFDALLVSSANTSEEWAKYPELYRPVAYDQFLKHFTEIDFSQFISSFTTKAPKQIVVFEQRFYDNFNEIIIEKNWELIKAWMIVKVAMKHVSLLSEEMRILGSAYGRFLSNIAEPRSQVKHQLDVTEAYFGQVIGLHYGQKYFGDAAKTDVKRMIDVMVAVYKERLDKNDWLSRATIDQAIEKLDAMTVMVGYPDKLPAIYEKLRVSDGSLYEDAVRFDEIFTLRHYEKFEEAVDKTEWHMPAHQVNAYNNPSANQIVFPVAILQAPFYSFEKQTASQNFGGIGAVIAHEISHSFDNNGAQFDKLGNLKKWWTDEDFKAFEKKQEDMVAQFDGVETEAGPANGKLVVSENIADNGGISAALYAAEKEDDFSAREFFVQWATVWRIKSSLEFQQMMLSLDVHAPGKLRANIPPTNFEEFYEAFEVQESDEMYRKPSERLIIW